MVKCYWCSRMATRKDYREIDGTISKIPSCNECLGTSTETLLSKGYESKLKRARTSYKKYYQGFKILMEYWDSLPDEEKEDIDKRLQKLGI